MYEIVEKQELNPQVTLMKVKAPRIAKKAKPGQFIILRIDELGERIPLTIADYDASLGTVTIIFQKVGKTTMALGDLAEGDSILILPARSACPPFGRHKKSGGYWRRFGNGHSLSAGKGAL
jgi:NAD(P)H-flavin reductase